MICFFPPDQNPGRSGYIGDYISQLYRNSHKLSFCHWWVLITAHLHMFFPNNSWVELATFSVRKHVEAHDPLRFGVFFLSKNSLSWMHSQPHPRVM